MNCMHAAINYAMKDPIINAERETPSAVSQEIDIF